MSICKHLTGENIKPHRIAEAKKLIGAHVEYLRQRDIDHSGRGYLFPRRGVVMDAAGRNILVGETWMSFSEISEMRKIDAAPTEAEGKE